MRSVLKTLKKMIMSVKVCAKETHANQHNTCSTSQITGWWVDTVSAFHYSVFHTTSAHLTQSSIRVYGPWDFSNSLKFMSTDICVKDTDLETDQCNHVDYPPRWRGRVGGRWGLKRPCSMEMKARWASNHTVCVWVPVCQRLGLHFVNMNVCVGYCFYILSSMMQLDKDDVVCVSPCYDTVLCSSKHVLACCCDSVSGQREQPVCWPWSISASPHRKRLTKHWLP
jgi:hypothetical protein